MAQLIVRRIEEEVVQELKARAVRHGRSAEAEHREILRQTLVHKPPPKSLKEMLLAIPPVGEDDDFARITDKGREVEL